MNTSHNLIIGIQGGPGSFNEEAIKKHIVEQHITGFEIKYFHTTEEVLDALANGSISQAQFAIRNSLGGEVAESTDAMSKHTFTKVATYDLKITHSLMLRKDATIRDVTTIMTHPQVLAQCKQTLTKKYPHIKLTSGDGELIDHALVAQHLGEKRLPKDIATIGSKVLAQLYDLQIADENLQDNNENYTSFLLVKSV